jgi:ribosomal protein L37AE/L43A
MEIYGNEIKQKLSKKYVCEYCDYSTERKSNFINHSNSAKHKIETNGNKIKQKISNIYKCDFCNKIYQTNAGLWKHNQKCIIDYQIEESKNNYFGDDETEVKILTNLVLEVVKQNHELIIQNNENQKYNQNLTNKIVELSKNCIGNTNISNSHNNSHNKTFNLQFFLNETCKDAMNIMDFVDSIKLQLSDLENVGKLGYVEGISNIITTNLKALDVTQRPIHCADNKREIMYIKDEDKWEKEDNTKKKIRKAIKRVVCKNQRLIPKFKEQHPDCNKSVSKFSDQYNKIIVESMGGFGDNDLEKEDKIIKNISKNVVIEKN